jgi:hypothetical protein
MGKERASGICRSVSDWPQVCSRISFETRPQDPSLPMVRKLGSRMSCTCFSHDCLEWRNSFLRRPVSRSKSVTRGSGGGVETYHCIRASSSDFVWSTSTTASMWVILRIRSENIGIEYMCIAVHGAQREGTQTALYRYRTSLRKVVRPAKTPVLPLGTYHEHFYILSCSHSAFEIVVVVVIIFNLTVVIRPGGARLSETVTYRFPEKLMGETLSLCIFGSGPTPIEKVQTNLFFFVTFFDFHLIFCVLSFWFFVLLWGNTRDKSRRFVGTGLVLPLRGDQPHPPLCPS